MAFLYDFHGEYDKELEQAEKVIEIDPNFAFGHVYRGFDFERKQMYAEAVESIARGMTLFGEPADCETEVRKAFAKNGIRGFWQKRLEQIEKRPHLKNFQAYNKALVQIRLGDPEGTIKSLNQAFENRDSWMVNAKYETRLNPVRNDPRFQNLLHRMGL